MSRIPVTNCTRGMIDWLVTLIDKHYFVVLSHLTKKNCFMLIAYLSCLTFSHCFIKTDPINRPKEDSEHPGRSQVCPAHHLGHQGHVAGR